MAAGILPKPGTELGPCEDHGCGHTDCAETRRMAAVICRLCGEPVGYERRFYDDEGRLVHGACLEDSV